MALSKKEMIFIGLGALLLVGVSAGASAYYVDQRNNEAIVETETVSETKTSHQAVPIQPEPQPAPAQTAQHIPACDDDNIVGKVAGGVVGGLVGTQIGKGGGNKAATIGGSVGGTLLGEEFIPTRNVTCR